MRAFLTAILFIAGSASAALCQNNSYSSAPTPQSVTEQNRVVLSAVPVSDSLLDVQRKAGGDSFGKASGERRSASKAEPVNQRMDDKEGRFWVSAEALFWKPRGTGLPPLITTGPDPGPGGTGRPGRIGEPGTVIVFGGERLDRDVFLGGRFTAGMWLNSKRSAGIELSYFFLAESTHNFQVSTTGVRGSNVIARPYINIFSGQEDVHIVGGPTAFQADPDALFPGSITATSPSRLRNAEANFIYRFDRSRVSLTGGFRYLDLTERLTLTDSRETISAFGVESRLLNRDDFFTRNRFYGGQVGARTNFGRGPFGLDISGTLALGINRQLVNISGSTHSISRFGNFNINRVGAVLAQGSNIGIYRRSEFTLVPEVRLSFGYDLTRFLRPFVGYDFLYWNKVVMPGEQIDRILNPAYLFGSIPSPPTNHTHPAFIFRDTRYWVMGLTTGVKVSF